MATSDSASASLPGLGVHLVMHGFSAVAILFILIVIVPVYSVYLRSVLSPEVARSTAFALNSSTFLYQNWKIVLPIAALADLIFVFGVLRTRLSMLRAWTGAVFLATILFSLVCHLGLAVPIQELSTRTALIPPEM